MGKKRRRLLNQYTGPLNPNQAAEGIRVAIENARRLLRDAELLLEHSRWARALSLSVLAIEEAGKVDLIRSVLAAGSPELRRSGWRDYRRHTAKNQLWTMGIFLGVPPRWEDTLPLFDEACDHPELCESVKQLGFYSDCLGDAHWSAPHEVIEEGFARQMYEIATSLVPDEQPAMSTAAELCLWVKHLRPVWGSDIAGMRRAMVECCREAEALGILQGRLRPDDLERFLL